MTRENEDREKLIYVPCACIFTDVCTFAPRILKSEKDDYLHRDTKPVVLFTYITHALCIFPLPLMALAYLSAFSYSHAFEKVFTGMKRDC